MSDQNIQQTKGNNVIFFKKFAIVIGFYYVCRLLAQYVSATVIAVALIDIGYPAAAVSSTISPVVKFQVFILILMSGLIGLFYGLRYASRKFGLSTKDVKPIIICFIGIQYSLLELMQFGQPHNQAFLVRELTLSVLLLINCSAIFFFSKKLLK